MTERFIVNHNGKLIHDREHLTERCNTDDIDEPEEADDLECFALIANSDGEYRYCQYCSREQGES